MPCWAHLTQGMVPWYDALSMGLGSTANGDHRRGAVLCGPIISCEPPPASEAHQAPATKVLPPYLAMPVVAASKVVCREGGAFPVAAHGV